MSLLEYRQKIDEIDREILELFQKRMDYVKEVANYKIQNDLPIFHPEREKEIIKEKSSLVQEEYKEYVAEFFEDMMNISKKMQQKIIDSTEE